MGWGEVWNNTPLGRAVMLLREFEDDEPCDYDHHGYCQAHIDFSDPPCRMTKLREFLKEIDS